MALQRVQAWRRLVVPGIVVVGLLMCMIGPVCSQLDDDDVHYDHDAVHEFNVEFDTDDALGMVLDDRLVVTGFRRGRGDDMGPAEATGWLQVGDRLVAINEIPLHDKNLMDTAQILRSASRPKILRFHTRHHDDRVARMQMEMAAKSDAKEAAGRLIFVHHDIPQGTFEFVQALFGGPPSCTPMPIATAEPRHACGQLLNERQLAGAIVIVERGMCAFSDKAINVQLAGAAGLLVLNDKGAAFRMPANKDESFDITIPAVMVDEVTADRVRNVMEFGMQPMQVQLEHSDRWCQETRNVTTDDSIHPKAAREIVATPPVLDHEFQSGRLLVAAQDNEDLGWLFSSPTHILRYEYVRALFGGEPCHVATMAIDARAELRASNYQIPHGHAANSSATPFNATNATRGAEDPFPHATTGAPLTLVEAEPAEACEPLHDRDGRLGGAVVLVKRGVCSFDVKQRHVAAAGGVAVVVANTQHGLTAMRAADAGKALQLPVVSVTTTAGQELRKAVREAQAAFSAVQVRFQGDDRFANAWASIQDLLDRKEAWPRSKKARRKLYFRLSREHHPDKPHGSQERFEAVSYAYKLASRRYDPSLGAIDDI